MEIEYFHIDAFTTRLFSGNPAGVCLLRDGWPDNGLMLAIARENGLAETAFVLFGRDGLHIRWFTPEIEMDLCGHATLAAAFVVATFARPGRRVEFMSASGQLRVDVDGNLVTMRLPLRPPLPAEAPRALLDSVNIRPLEIRSARDFVFVYGAEEDIRNIEINNAAFNTLDLAPGGLCVTAPGRDADFVSRFFTPNATIMEDPVTGSAHCSLVPYWANVLGRRELVAMQLSARGGTLYCTLQDDAVIVAGNAVLYKRGVLLMP